VSAYSPEASVSVSLTTGRLRRTRRAATYMLDLEVGDFGQSLCGKLDRLRHLQTTYDVASQQPTVVAIWRAAR
jgi:hypothetical protein